MISRGPAYSSLGSRATCSLDATGPVWTFVKWRAELRDFKLARGKEKSKIPRISFEKQLDVIFLLTREMVISCE